MCASPRIYGTSRCDAVAIYMERTKCSPISCRVYTSVYFMCLPANIFYIYAVVYRVIDAPPISAAHQKSIYSRCAEKLNAKKNASAAAAASCGNTITCSNSLRQIKIALWTANAILLYLSFSITSFYTCDPPSASYYTHCVPTFCPSRSPCIANSSNHIFNRCIFAGE